MKNKAIKVVGTIVIVGGIIFFATGVGAQELNGRDVMQIRQIHPKMDKDKENQKSIIHHIDKEEAEAIRTALENKDYETWKNLILVHEEKLPKGAKSILSKINSKEVFEKFSEKMLRMHEKKEMKNIEKEAIIEKIEANDYEGWKELITEREENIDNLKFSMLEKIDTEAKFVKLVKIHSLRQEIKELNKDLGLLNLGMKHGKILGIRR